MTAHYLSTDTYRLKAGDTCLIHAGAGGVGLLLTQMAKMRGARVVTTVSSDEKAELSKRAGADEVVLYTRDDFEVEVKRLTDGRGVQVVYDSVGQATFEKSLAALAPRGMLVLFGQSSGKPGKLVTSQVGESHDRTRLVVHRLFILKPAALRFDRDDFKKVAETP
jgi:NADPH2:quinone reductase